TIQRDFRPCRATRTHWPENCPQVSVFLCTTLSFHFQKSPRHNNSLRGSILFRRRRTASLSQLGRHIPILLPLAGDTPSCLFLGVVCKKSGNRPTKRIRRGDFFRPRI